MNNEFNLNKIPFLGENISLDYSWTSSSFTQAISWGHNFSVKGTGRYIG